MVEPEPVPDCIRDYIDETTGMDERRAQRALDGDDAAPVPHWVPPKIAALSAPGAMDRARQLAETFIMEDDNG